LLTPSGIAADLTAAAFFKSLSTAGRVLTLFDFENGRMAGGPAFPDVHRSFKFCAFIAGGPNRTMEAAECAFFLDAPPMINDPRLFRMTATDFARVNPNTGTAPIFRGARDAEITRAIYRRLPVLVDRSSGAEVKALPISYATMFHMTNDSHLFWSPDRLEKEGAYPIGAGCWAKAERRWLPLYEGKMVQAFDHRAATVTVNLANVHRPAQGSETTEIEHQSTDWTPTAQFAVDASSLGSLSDRRWFIGFKDVTAPTNVRSMIAAVLPACAAGNTICLMLPDQIQGDDADTSAKLLGNLNSVVFDYGARAKIQGQHLNWFIVEQLPVIPLGAYVRHFGKITAADLVRDHVLRLSYTAHDLADFALDIGHVSPDGEVLPPFKWDETERRHLRARLDALYFILYGITDPSDVDHILSTFPIVERKDRAAHQGVYLTRELIHWYMRALQAGDVERIAPEADLIAQANRRRAA
jgi:hypothetical protein